MVLNNHKFLKPLVLLAALKQFEYQATNRLLLAVSEGYGDSGTTQKDVKKTPAKMLLFRMYAHVFTYTVGKDSNCQGRWYNAKYRSGICMLPGEV